jgi:hypothetical protein
MEDYADSHDALGDHYHFKRLSYYRLFVAIHTALATGDFSPFNRAQTQRAALRSAWTALKSTPAVDPIRAMAKRLIGLGSEGR